MPERNDTAVDPYVAEDAVSSAGSYSFTGVLQKYSLPWPAWEVGPQTLVVFNQPKYADYKFKYLEGQSEAFEAAQPSEAQLSWAQEYVARIEGFGERDVPGHEQLAKAMVVANDNALISFPKPLAFFNHMTFFGCVSMILVALLLCVWGRRKAEQLKPINRVQHMIEAVTLYIRNEVVRPNIHHGDAWTPHFTAIFFAILGFNLFGLIPGGGAPTAHIAVTGAFAIATMFIMLVFGMRAQGVGAYWKNLVPVPFSLKPLDFIIWLILAVIEVAGLLIKPAALAIRLFANMFAGKAVIVSFTSLFFIVMSAGANELMAGALGGFGLLLAAAIILLKVLVSFIQAYVFTLLSALFVGASIHPDH